LLPAARRCLRGRGGYHPAVTPLLLVAAGVLAISAGAAILMSYGPRFRVGRLLASTPAVGVAEALEIAASGRPRYVRIAGRIDAEDEFEDVHHRPLVFRRTRLEARRNGRWVPFEDSRETVPFEIREGGDSIAVDAAAIDAGLVVVRRESVGSAGDLADRAPTDLPPDTRVRAVVEQLSSVDHATILGVPMAGEDPAVMPRMTAGLGRPIVVTTLEPAEAMRVLGGGGNRPRVAAALFAAGAILLVAGAGWAAIGAIAGRLVGDGVPAAFAATPSAGAAAGDPRSPGEGPGLVGEPMLALLAVLAIAVVAIVLTTAYVRLTSRSEKPKAGRR
jgi:hypothetical protein